MAAGDVCLIETTKRRKDGRRLPSPDAGLEAQNETREYFSFVDVLRR